MVNADYNILKDWMFGKLASLLEDIEPNPEYPVLKMSLGDEYVEGSHETGTVDNLSWFIS